MAYSTWRNEAECHRERLERLGFARHEIDRFLAECGQEARAQIERERQQKLDQLWREYEARSEKASEAARIWRQPAQEQKRDGWKKGIRLAARAEARRKAVLRLCEPLLAHGEAACEEDYEFGWLDE